MTNVRESVMSLGAARDFVGAAYRAAMRREADSEGLEFYSARIAEGSLSPADLLRAFIESEEYRGLASKGSDYDPKLDPLLAPYRSSDSEALVRELRASDASHRARLAELHGAAVACEGPQGQEYLRFHQRRFVELFDAMHVLLRAKKQPRILDIGLSPASRWYSEFFPDLRLVTADRPGAEPADYCEHVALDLNAEDYSSLDVGAPYDLIVFTEVLEHLSVHPVTVLGGLIERLAPSGSLYLTTPNFFSRRNLSWIALRKNPQAIFPKSNEDAHHHTREFCMSEMFPLIEEAGGTVAAWYFSDCWDHDGVDEHELANMIFVVRPAAQ